MMNLFLFSFSWRVDRLDIKKERRVMIYMHPDIKNGGHPEALPESEQPKSDNSTDSKTQTDDQKDKNKG